MSVYTTLTLKEVQDFAAPYGLEVIDLIPIQGGIQNTNYFLVCENQQYVLTVLKIWMNRPPENWCRSCSIWVRQVWPYRCLYPTQAKPFTR